MYRPVTKEIQHFDDASFCILMNIACNIVIRTKFLKNIFIISKPNLTIRKICQLTNFGDRVLE